jgi:hypothetical protein
MTCPAAKRRSAAARSSWDPVDAVSRSHPLMESIHCDAFSGLGAPPHGAAVQNVSRVRAALPAAGGGDLRTRTGGRASYEVL